MDAIQWMPQAAATSLDESALLPFIMKMKLKWTLRAVNASLSVCRVSLVSHRLQSLHFRVLWLSVILAYQFQHVDLTSMISILALLGSIRPAC